MHLRSPLKGLRKTVLAATCASLFSVSAMAQQPLASNAADVTYNAAFLRKTGGPQVNLSQFSRGNSVMPGDYQTDLNVNGNWVGRVPVRVLASKTAGEDAQPCLNQLIVESLGLDDTKLSPQASAELARAKGGACFDLKTIAPEAVVAFDPAEQHLDISIPQAFLLDTAPGYVRPELWETGATSATIAYNSNFSYNAVPHGKNTTSGYIGSLVGLNIGDWHFRNNGSLSLNEGHARWQNIATYLQHDIPSLRSQLSVGEIFTDSTLLNSVPIRGIQIGSDDRMLSSNMRSYSPMIRGIASSNAKVVVSQNGNKIFETTVTPGPFAIDNVSPPSGGDLLVTVIEADGSEKSFFVPYASVPQLLHPGTLRYNLAAGQFNRSRNSQHDLLFQGTLQYGISNLLTGYIGTIVSEHYLSGLIGSAWNTPVGAIALDFTQASAQIPNMTNTTGQSLRLSYSKFFAPTHTGFVVGAYRYMTKGFLSLTEAMDARENAAAGGNGTSSFIGQRRDQLQLTLSQSLPDGWGNLYLITSAQNYYRSSDKHGADTSLQLGYNNSLHLFGNSLSYSLSLTHQQNGSNGRPENKVFLSLSIPLGKTSQAQMSAGFMQGSHTQSQQLSVGGSLGDEHAFSYGVTTLHDSAGAMSGSLNAQYRAPYTSIGANASVSQDYEQASLGLSGGIVAHAGGITFANAMGDTVAIVEAKGAAGAHISGATNTVIDSHGYAVVPYLSPYTLNTINIDPTEMASDVEFKSTSAQIAPRANAVIPVHFDTLGGQPVMIEAATTNGKTLPFGASVLDDHQNLVSMVGQHGRIFTHGLSSGPLTVKWGSGPSESCQISFQAPAAKAHASVPYAQLVANCQPGGSPSWETKSKSQETNASAPTPSGEQETASSPSPFQPVSKLGDATHLAMGN